MKGTKPNSGSGEPKPSPAFRRTSADKLKQQVLRIAGGLLTDLKEDIVTGVEDGLYEKNENVRRLQWIEKAFQALETFREFSPTIYICVEGGLVQGASADADLTVNLFDMDNYENGTLEDRKEFEENFGTPKDWDTMIREGTASRRLKPVY